MFTNNFMISTENVLLKKVHFMVMIICVFIGYLIASVFMAVAEMAIDTILLAFCLDCEQNNGNPAYAPPLLMDAMGVADDYNKKKLEKKGGEIGAQVALVDLDPDMKPGALRREFSKLLQVQMVALARAKMVPEISKKIDSIGLPNRVILSKVKEVVFDIAEKVLRKVINERVKLVER